MEIHNFEKYPIKFYKGDKLIGSTYSLLTFDDFRLQVRKEQSEEYSFEFKGVRYKFSKNGEYPDIDDEDFPYKISINLLYKLL